MTRVTMMNSLPDTWTATNGKRRSWEVVQVAQLSHAVFLGVDTLLCPWNKRRVDWVNLLSMSGCLLSLLPVLVGVSWRTSPSFLPCEILLSQYKNKSGFKLIILTGCTQCSSVSVINLNWRNQMVSEESCQYNFQSFKAINRVILWIQNYKMGTFAAEFYNWLLYIFICLTCKPVKVSNYEN